MSDYCIENDFAAQKELAAQHEDRGAVSSNALFGDWLPIETAPKGRKAVLVYRDDTKCTYGATWDDITNEWRHFGGSRYPVGGEITHWMPLPSPPNASVEAPRK